MNQGIHTVDLLLWLFGPVAGVLGRTANRLHRIEVEDTAVAALEFENGALGTVEATTATHRDFRAASKWPGPREPSSTRMRRGRRPSPTRHRTAASSRISSAPSAPGPSRRATRAKAAAASR